MPILYTLSTQEKKINETNMFESNDKMKMIVICRLLDMPHFHDFSFFVRYLLLFMYMYM